MKKLLLLLSTLGIFTPLAQAIDVKISQLPLASSSSTTVNDSFPYVDASTNVTRRLTVWSLSSLPSLVTTYAPLASPMFSGTVTATAFSGPLTGNVTGNVTGNLTGNSTGLFTGTIADAVVTGTTNAALAAPTTDALSLNNAFLVSVGTIGATSGQVNGRHLRLYNNGAGSDIVLKNDYGSAANSIVSYNSSDVTLKVGQWVDLEYYNTRWNLILPPLVGNLTGNVTGNLTGNVTGDVTGNVTGNTTGGVTTTDSGFTMKYNLNSGVIAKFSASGLGVGTATFSFPSDGSGTLVTNNSSATLTNKTLTSPTLNGGLISNAFFKTATFEDPSDTTKQLTLDMSGIATGNSVALDFTGSATLTFPSSSGTLATLARAETFTNKTLSGNTAATLISGSGILTLNTSGTVTLPNATDTLVGKATTDTLTNKTLTGPVISTIVNTGTLTLPTATDTLVGRATTDTLTNKTLTGNTAANLISGSGTLTLNTTGTVTLPNATDTLVGKATTDTLTNKTLTGNTAVNLVSGSGTLTLNTTGTVTLPNATDTLVGKATTDTLTNKTLTAPVISTISNSGTLTLPAGPDTLVGKATTDTLTNKSISGSSNTITNVPLSTAVTGQLATANGGTGQNSTATFPTSGVVVTEAGSETLTNKTLTAPIMSTISNTGTLTLPTATGTLALDPLTTKGDLVVRSSTAAARLGVGADGAVLTADSAQTNGIKWATPASAPSASYEVSNGSLASSVAASALTIALKDAGGSDPSSGSPVKIGMRSSTATTGTYSQRSVVAALSLVINSGTTLGFAASTSTGLYAYAIDSDGAGTMKLGASTAFLDDSVLQSAVAESFTATISNASPGVLTATGHGLNNGDQVSLTTTGTLPTGLSTGTTYYVVSSAANTFSLASVSSGTAINTSSSGSGIHTVHIAGSRLVSDAVYSAKAIRLLGRLTGSVGTPGTWTSFPAEIDPLTTALQSAPVAVRYLRSTTESTTNSFTVFDYSTKDYDSCGCVTTGAGWKFIAPVTGYYHVAIQNTWGASGTRTADAWNYIISLYKNGTSTISLAGSKTDSGQTAANAQTLASGGTDIYLLAGENIQVAIFEEQGYTATVADGTKNWITINQIR